MTKQESSSIADTWFWEYREDVDEWDFFADDYEPVNSVKITRRYGSPLPLFLRGFDAI